MSEVEVKRVPLLVLDIDGTVRQSVNDPLGRFVNGPDDVVIFPEVVPLMNAWKRRGGRIIGVSNQGGLAIGFVTFENMILGMRKTYLECNSLFDNLSVCQHHPEAKDPDLRRCWCRKPAPGMVIEAALNLSRVYSEMYPPQLALFVGDREEDRRCAEICSIDFMWAKDWRATGVKQ